MIRCRGLRHGQVDGIILALGTTNIHVFRPVKQCLKARPQDSLFSGRTAFVAKVWPQFFLIARPKVAMKIG